MSERTTDSLNDKELSFCEHYVALGEPTCGNATASARAAGYAEKHAGNAAWKLMQRPVIREKIQELHKARMDKNLINPERVLHDLEHTRILALAKADLAVAARCSELQGKYLAMFTDRQQLVGPEQQRELDERERQECLALAAIRLGACLSLPGGDGEAVGVLGEGGEKCPEDIPHRPPEATRLDSTLLR